MDAKKAIAAVPLLRRLWRILPGPLRLPLLLVGGVYALYRFFRDRQEERTDQQTTNTSSGR